MTEVSHTQQFAKTTNSKGGQTGINNLVDSVFV